jgi:hypothetical protein
LDAWIREEEYDMSAAAVLGIVLVIGFVGVALIACIAWRHRMRESISCDDWRQAVQDDAARSSKWNREAARLAANVKEVCL